MIYLKMTQLHKLQVLSILLLGYVSCQQLLENPGFEQPLDGDDWFCNGNCDLTQDTDAHTGVYSGRVSNRDIEWKVVSQYVHLTPNSTYYFECWIKLLNLTEGTLYDEAEMRIQFYFNDMESEHRPISAQPHVSPERGWIKMSGDFYLDQTEFTKIRIYVRFLQPNVNYLIDTTSLVKLTPDPNWKEDANARIEAIRKSDITINLNILGDYDPTLVTVEVNQTSHKFAFGSAVREEQMIGSDEDSQKYRQCFFENFYWSVFHNAHKWKQMEKIQDEIEYPDEALQVLRDAGIPVRGHCLFWNKAQNTPEWVIPLSSEDTVEQMRKRANYTVPRYKGEVIHWDVNNEQLHGDFYEDKTGNIDIMTQLFKEVKTYDEDALLFLNDFNLVKLGRSTQAMVNLAERLLSQDAPVDGIGVQSHLIGPITLDAITAMQKRLEIVSSTGLPLWVTELDINEITVANELADAYDDVITLYFSDPAIQGVILWGFSDLHHSKPDAAMFEGPDYIPNASGLRWQEMTRERWHTFATFQATSTEDTFGTRGFYGSYMVKVVYEGTDIETLEFYLENEDVTIDIDI